MEERRNEVPHYLLRAGIASGLSLYILKLFNSDTMIYYIAPRMNQYLKYAAIVLIMIAVYQAYLALTAFFGQKMSCNCSSPSSSFTRHLIFYLLFFIPLSCGYFVPDSLMGSVMAAKKGVNLTNVMNIKPKAAETTAALPGPSPSPSAAPSETAIGAPNSASAPSSTVDDEKLRELFKADSYDEDFAKLAMKLYKKDKIDVKEEGFMEIIQSISLFMDPFVGKPIEMTGFVYRENNMKSDQFVVSRFGISCCSADASPFGLMVESPMANNLNKDTWVKVTGTIGKTTYGGNEIVKIDATKIEKVPAPKTPYVYPNYDYLDKANP